MYKLVNESLFEFKKGLDPVDSLGMGRRGQIKDWLDSMNIINYTINDDYTIDVDSEVLLPKINMNEFPTFIQFNKVYSFFVQETGLTSLRGCPKYVKYVFSCWNNNLSSLKYSPDYVGYNYYCGQNCLASLEHVSLYIGNNFNCEYNRGIKFTKQDFKKDNPQSDVKGGCSF